jgi:hypothetical protein
LEGIRVIDLSHVLAAPTTTMFLADLGAEVIHLAPSGDVGDSGLYPGTDRSSEGRRRYRRDRLAGCAFSRRMPPHAAVCMRVFAAEGAAAAGRFRFTGCTGATDMNLQKPRL